MWVCSAAPLEKRISRCFPRASTASTTLPSTRWRRAASASTGSRERKEVTVRPASAACSRVAARRMVSPSGIFVPVHVHALVLVLVLVLVHVHVLVPVRTGTLARSQLPHVSIPRPVRREPRLPQRAGDHPVLFSRPLPSQRHAP